MSSGEVLRMLAMPGQPVQIAGVVNAQCALEAKRAGFLALYVSGGATAAALGLPDLAVLGAHDFIDATARVTAVTDLPVLVDADTGFGAAPALHRAVRAYAAAGAAGMHIEDQLGAKRCGHRPNKVLCTAAEMVARVQVACAARQDSSFVVMARTDALATEGLDATLVRARAYVAAGADMLFLEGATAAAQYAACADATRVPVLANITEFGVTPLLTLAELAAAEVALVLYPLTAYRMMMHAAQRAYATLLADGGQAGLLNEMQTREELYATLDYHGQERLLDEANVACSKASTH